MSRKYVCDVPDCEETGTEVLTVLLRARYVSAEGVSEKLLKKPDFKIHICSEHEDEVLERAEKVKKYILTGEIENED